MLSKSETSAPVRLREVPMDLTDPFYAQFWPGGVMPIKRARDVGLSVRDGGPGALGSYSTMYQMFPGEDVSRATKRLREAHGMNQQQVARLAGLGAGTRISEIERRPAEQIGYRTVRALAYAFHLTVDEFLSYANDT